MAKIIDLIVHELLHDLRELTSRRFIYEDPWHGFVPSDGAPAEYQIGPPLPFAELGRRDKADVIDSFIHWNEFQEKGLDWRDQNTIANNVIDAKPPHQWLEGTSFRDPSVRAERREELIQETFELSREIGYAYFRAENFDRPDPVLVQLSPEQRETFLREWWDAARERMYASYLEQIAGMSNEELARNREAYKGVIAAGDLAISFEKTPDQAAGEIPGQNDDRRSSLRDALFSAAAPQPGPQPEHTHERQHKR